MKSIKKLLTGLVLAGCFLSVQANPVYLHSDNPQLKWKLKPQSEVDKDALLKDGYDAAAWVDAVVPGLNSGITDKVYLSTTVECLTIGFNKERKNLSLNKPAYASSTTHGEAALITDGKSDTRWAAAVADNEWVYVDLGSVQPVGGVRLDWEASYGKSYKIQVSDDATNWKEVYKTSEGKGGPEVITFPEVDARYVRMFGIERGWWFGYSLWSFDVLGGTQASEGLTDVHFIRLKLKDKNGRVLSENNYWRGNDRLDFTALNRLPKADLKVSSKLLKADGNAQIEVVITNLKSAKSAAFAIHVQAVRATDGERLLPAIMNDNYFTLMPGESKNVTISFDEALLNRGGYKLLVTPYNK